MLSLTGTRAVWHLRAQNSRRDGRDARQPAAAEATLISQEGHAGATQPGSAPVPTRARFAALGGFIAAIWVIALSRWIATDTVVPWDSKNQFFAFFSFLATALHSGATPFWNPYHYGGHPSVADPQSLVLSPVFVLWALFDPTPSLRGFDLIVYAHLLVGGLAMGAIGWRARWPLSACVLAAALFMFGGAAAGRLQHTGIILSYALFPPALLFLQLALARRSILLALAFALIAAQLALGRNQVALLLCFLLAAFALAEIVTADRPVRYLRERLAVLTIMALGVTALVAAPMLLTLQFAALSNRPTVGFEEAIQGSLHPANLATLAVADVFDTHGPNYWGPDAQTLPEVRFTDDSFNYLFVGAGTTVLFFWFGIAGAGAFRRGRRLLTTALVVSLLYMLGRYTPFFPFAFAWWPGVSLFRRPVDASFVFLIALGLLSGYLLADYVREGLPRLRIVPSVIAAAGAIAIAVSAAAFSARTGHAADAFFAALKVAPLAILPAVLLWAARMPRMRAYAAAAVVTIAVIELIWWNAAFRLNAESRSHYAVLERPTGGEAQAIAVLEEALRARHAQGERPRVEVLGLGGPWQNLASVRGWEAINGYNPLRIGAYDRLVAPGESNWRPDLRDFPASFAGYDCPLAHALGLEFLVLGQPIDQVPALKHRPVADVLLAGPSIWIYRLHDPMPRITFAAPIAVADAGVGSARPAPAPRPDHMFIADDTPPLRRHVDLPAVGHARLASWRPDRVDIEASSERGGVLTLHGNYYPGWIAEIDGKASPILRADVLFRAVEVPAGRHHVVFRYAPFTWRNLADALRLALTH
jgi:hypothetical protein